eukprot:SAG31_NODE_1005_length_10432_cov_16.909909_10_plen_77_part_00
MKVPGNSATVEGADCGTEAAPLQTIADVNGFSSTNFSSAAAQGSQIDRYARKNTGHQADHNCICGQSCPASVGMPG